MFWATQPDCLFVSTEQV